MTQLPNWFNEMQKTVLDKMKTLALPKADGTVIKKWAEFSERPLRYHKRINYANGFSPLFYPPSV